MLIMPLNNALLHAQSKSNPTSSPLAPRQTAGDRYAIHGTNRPSSIGTFASAGCVRMLKDDVLDLFEKSASGHLSSYNGEWCPRLKVEEASRKRLPTFS